MPLDEVPSWYFSEKSNTSGASGRPIPSSGRSTRRRPFATVDTDCRFRGLKSNTDGTVIDTPSMVKSLSRHPACVTFDPSAIYGRPPVDCMSLVEVDVDPCE
jgi:hypothetical protein